MRKMKKKNRSRNINNNTNTMKENKKMEKIMKTGIIAAGIVTAGLAFGTSSVTAEAAELDTEEAAVQAVAETTVPASVQEAQNAADEAKAEVDKANTAVNEAQAEVSDAQQNVADASDKAAAARSEADQVFEAAKEDAAQADAAAQKAVEDAEQAVDEADGNVQQAEEAVSSAKESVEETENSVSEAISESTITENDIAEKESEVDEAVNAFNDAEASVDEAESAKEEAASEAEDKEAVKREAGEAVRDAEAEKNAADAAVDAAETAARQAAQDLQSAEDLKNGTVNIEDTTQYKEAQEAKKMMDNANEKVETAAEDTNKAAEELANANAAVDAAEKELDSAVEDLNNRKSELSKAEKIKEAADQAKEEAQEACDIADVVADYADEAVIEAENDVAKAEDEVKRAEEAKEAADAAVKEAADAVDTAREDAEAAVNADIEKDEKEAAEKQEAAWKAKEALAAAEENYKQGTLGLIDWMLTKDGLTKDQIQDLNFAREVLVNASQEDFTKWYGGDNTGLPEERNGKVVVIGDEKDATNLENLLKSIEIMKKINELRASDDNFTGDLQREASYTNFYFMATAEAGAMRGAGLRRHSSLTTSCEDLAFGYSDPTAGWYNQEKAVFDRIKGELGITQITSMADIEKIEAEADNQGVIIGHYTNLFLTIDQVMGVGYTQYRATSCYNASNASYYRNDSYNRAMHLYSVEEFEQLVLEYYQSVNKTACEEALEKAVSEQTDAQNRLQTLQSDKDAVIEAAIKDVQEELAFRKTAAEQAAQNLSDAKEVLASEEKALDDAKAEKLSADQTLQEAQNALNEAVGESQAADIAFNLAKKAEEDAEQAVADAETVLKDAVNGKTSAASVLEEKQDALADANTALDKACAAYEAAAKKLADLTSDGTIDALREQKTLADAALQTALENQEAKAGVLEQAEAVLVQAEEDVSNAKTALQEAENRLAEAAAARDQAKEKADQANAELADLREQYGPVLRAIAARDAAKENLCLAETALTDAEAKLVKAKADLTQAQLTKAITADRLFRATGLSVDNALKADIEDSDYAYLNEYVSGIKAADTAFSTAKERLATAEAELSARKADSEEAQKAYIAAVADLVIAQDQAGVFQADTEPTVLNVSEDSSRPVLPKVGSIGNVYSTEPVETGDTSNAIPLLVEILAGAGIAAVGLKMRKEKEQKNEQ